MCLLCLLWLLEQQFRGQLQLPRIEHRSGTTEKRIRNRRASQGTTAYLTSLDGATCRVLVLHRLWAATEIVGAVDAGDFIHIRAVERVEGVNGELHPGSFAREIERASEAKVP